MLLLIGGLSGAGKSTLGEYLENRCGFCWIELDQIDAVEKFDIRPQWEALYLAGDPGLLTALYHGDTVITVPSGVIFPVRPYPAEVRIRYLWGDKHKCFDRAHARCPHLVDQNHWDTNNKCMLAHLGSGACSHDWKIDVFEENGAPRTLEGLAFALTSGR